MHMHHHATPQTGSLPRIRVTPLLQPSRRIAVPHGCFAVASPPLHCRITAVASLSHRRNLGIW
jgi:hypothetical protein